MDYYKIYKSNYPWEVADRRRSYTTICLGPVSHHFRVNGAGDTVVKLGVQFRQLIRLIKAGFRYVPDSSGLDDIANNKLFDGLVLGDATSAVGTANWIYMAATVLGASTVPAFGSLASE